jgi:hypothetical protein
MSKEKFDRSKPHVNIGTDWARGSREDDVDSGDHEGAGEKQPEGAVRGV